MILITFHDHDHIPAPSRASLCQCHLVVYLNPETLVLSPLRSSGSLGSWSSYHLDHEENKDIHVTVSFISEPTEGPQDLRIIARNHGTVAVDPWEDGDGTDAGHYYHTTHVQLEIQWKVGSTQLISRQNSRFKNWVSRYR